MPTTIKLQHTRREGTWIRGDVNHTLSTHSPTDTNHRAAAHSDSPEPFVFVRIVLEAYVAAGRGNKRVALYTVRGEVFARNVLDGAARVSRAFYWSGNACPSVDEVSATLADVTAPLTRMGYTLELDTPVADVLAALAADVAERVRGAA